ncbi:MAG: hypothetical protein IJS52_10020 [Bacilli bacterium]|nr:hypothetical protein [Bacilli bacterium]
MKTYACRRCGKKFAGRLDRCPRCGQRIVYCINGKYYDCVGNELILKKNRIVGVVPNPHGPRF